MMIMKRVVFFMVLALWVSGAAQDSVNLGLIPTPQRVERGKWTTERVDLTQRGGREGVERTQRGPREGVERTQRGPREGVERVGVWEGGRGNGMRGGGCHRLVDTMGWGGRWPGWRVASGRGAAVNGQLSPFGVPLGYAPAGGRSGCQPCRSGAGRYTAPGLRCSCIYL